MTDTATTLAPAPEAGFGDYVALLKPRVMSLVVFTALAGMVVAPGAFSGQMHVVEAFAAILFIAVGAGASGALNMWWDADIDAVMRRTARRPVPSGRVTGGEALAVGLGLSGLSVMMLALAANLFAAGLLAFTIFFYAVVYSMWLKRSTPQNIVIGGAAGAFPPVIGWAVVTGGTSIEAWLMFALIFLWTPPHFWALALFMKDDYHRAGVPMLTVTHGRRATRTHILAYTVALVPVSLALALSSIGGPLTLAVVVVLNAVFLRGAWAIRARTEDEANADGHAVEKRVFRFSLFYTFLHFGALMAETALAPFGLGGW